MQPLSENQLETFSWPSLPRLVRLGSPVEMSYSSAILSAFYKPYIHGNIDGIPVKRREILKQFEPHKFQANIFLLEKETVKIKDYKFDWPSILLLKFTNTKYPESDHYETVGLAPEIPLGEIKTIFMDGDPLLISLLAMKSAS